MTVSDFLTSHHEFSELPLLMIDQDGNVVKWQKCSMYQICHPDKYWSHKYLQSCSQLDLNGEEKFIIIYYEVEV